MLEPRPSGAGADCDVAEVQESRIVLSLLDAVSRDSTITQRSIADRLGIAVGLVNAYVRRCVEKGFIKITTAPLRRYAYYLTPVGFAEKSRLTMEYLATSLEFFRKARKECGTLLLDCHRNGWNRVVLLGAGELAEIAILSALEAKAEIVAVVDETRVGESCAGHTVTAAPPAFDAVLVTDTRRPGESIAVGLGLIRSAGLDDERLLVPRLLGIDPMSLQGGAVP